MKITPRFFKKRAPEKVHATWYTWSSDLTDVAGLTISIDTGGLRIEMSKSEAINLGVQLCHISEYIQQQIAESSNLDISPFHRGRVDALRQLAANLNMKIK